MPLPSSSIRPHRLSGRVVVLLLVALLADPAGSSATGAAPSSREESGAAATTTELRLPARFDAGSAEVTLLLSPQRNRGSAARGADWLWPLPLPHPVTGPYEAPPHRYAAGHRGIDISAAAGTSVTAPDTGVVHFVGVVVDRPVLSIRHADGVISSFEPVSSVLVAGQTVERGAQIGVLLSGHRPDRGPQPSLHLGVRVHGEYLSPLRFLGEIRASVLLPTRRR